MASRGGPASNGVNGKRGEELVVDLALSVDGQLEGMIGGVPPTVGHEWRPQLR
jgi:hypothetical protein